MGMPVCFVCALMVGDFMQSLFDAAQENPVPEYDELPPGYHLALADYVANREAAQEEIVEREAPASTSVVYYLMTGPTTVKIGYTANLRRRISSLRSELQYVVAVEHGGRGLEQERHRQFAADRRHKRREDFQLSEALKRHIDELASRRGEVLKQVWDSPI